MSRRQQDRLLAYLETRGPIPPLEAWVELGIYRLSARVYALRHHRGVAISKRKAPVENQFGETCRVAQYRLEPPAE